MHFPSSLASVLAGAFLCNSIPHLACGLRGESFPTPFAKPPGVGLSSALTNTLWGSANLILGCLCLQGSDALLFFNLDSILFFAGFLGIGAHLSIHFAKVRKK